MSAYEEFTKEKKEIDDYLERGYTIVSLADNLDGTEVRFIRSGSPEPEQEQAVLLLLNPDSRKYVAGLVCEYLFNRKLIS